MHTNFEEKNSLTTCTYYLFKMKYSYLPSKCVYVVRYTYKLASLPSCWLIILRYLLYSSLLFHFWKINSLGRRCCSDSSSPSFMQNRQRANGADWSSSSEPSCWVVAGRIREASSQNRSVWNKKKLYLEGRLYWKNCLIYILKILHITFHFRAMGTWKELVI